eukprot:3662935-Prymnesium_polylepis.1
MRASASAAPGPGACKGVTVKKLGAAHQLFRAVAHSLPPGSEATRAVNMCKVWVTSAAAAAQRSLGTYKRPPECLMSGREGP